MNIPQFVSIGHITHDLVGDGITLGGPALYSTCTARNLGIRTGMVTSFNHPLLQSSLLRGIDICCKKSQHTTTFMNLYNEAGERRQIIKAVADRIEPELVPTHWRAAQIVNICPVANEYTADLVRMFDNTIIGVCPQGWMRQWNADGHVVRKKWEGFREILPYADVVFFSEEDVTSPEKLAHMYLTWTKMVVITRGEHGASVYMKDGEHHVPAFSAAEVDPTGAGDVFAAAFLICYAQTHDPLESTRFANCVASFVVEKQGIDGIPWAEEVQQRLKKQIP